MRLETMREIQAGGVKLTRAEKEYKHRIENEARAKYKKLMEQDCYGCLKAKKTRGL